MRLRGVVTILGICLGIAALAPASWADHDMAGSHMLAPDDVQPGTSVRYPFVCSGNTCTLLNEVCQDKAKGIVRPKSPEKSAMAGAPMPAKPAVMVWKPLGPDQINMYGRQFEIPPCQ
jgi:hypothetical protein